MKLDKVAGSGNDEFYTPRYAVLPIAKYLKAGSKIWCPFDTEDSNYYKELTLLGHDVIPTHISKGEDFFDTSTEVQCDYIISNPPYSLKGEVFSRLFELKTPFAMLVGLVGIFESQFRFKMFRDNTFEVLYLNKRVSYFKDYSDQVPSLNPPFSSGYITSSILPDRICFEEIDKKLI